MSDTDSSHVGCFDDTTLLFTVPEGLPDPPLIDVITSLPRMEGVLLGLAGLRMQGTKQSGSQLCAVASVAGWNSSFCYGLIGGRFVLCLKWLRREVSYGEEV